MLSIKVRDFLKYQIGDKAAYATKYRTNHSKSLKYTYKSLLLQKIFKKLYSLHFLELLLKRNAKR